MNHTTNYQLNQWEASDRVQRTDFNADNAKIDAAIKAVAQTAASKGNCQIVCGSYTGTGKYGENNPNWLTFPFQPKIVFIGQKACASASGFTFAIQGEQYFCPASSNGGGDTCYATWSGNTLSWYATSHSTAQLNLAEPYFYVALG